MPRHVPTSHNISVTALVINNHGKPLAACFTKQQTFLLRRVFQGTKWNTKLWGGGGGGWGGGVGGGVWEILKRECKVLDQ